MRLPFILLFFIFSGCSYPLVQHEKVQHQLTLLIETETCKERQLDILSPIQIEYSRKEQTEKQLLAIIKKDLTPEYFQNLQKALFVLGLNNQKNITLEAMVKDLTNEVAGFYDPLQKKLYLTDWLNHKGFFISSFEFMLQKDLSGKLLFSHEFTHALQDQHFNLEKFVSAHKRDNLDSLLARQAVVEGDATAACLNVLTKDYGKSLEDSPEFVDSLQKEAAKFTRKSILNELLIFPYYGGLKFCREVLIPYQWEGINQLYKNPPTSTEQILHPEKYLKVKDEPKPLPSVSFDLPKRYHPIFENTLGELGIQMLCKKFTPLNQALQASEGWGNDRYFIFETPQETLSFIWFTLWDSPLDAWEFTNTYISITQKKHHVKGLPSTSSANKNYYSLSKAPKGQAIMIKRVEDRVWIMEGFPLDLTEKTASTFK